MIYTQLLNTISSLSCYELLSFSGPKCQVSTMSVIYPYLYVGTSWGCLVVAEATTMRQLSVIRSHSDNSPYIKTLLPLVPQSSTQEVGDEKEAGLLTVGRGYRDLISQHIKMADNKKISQNASMYLLSWHSADWK